MTTFPPSSFLSSNWRNTVIHILQAGNSTNVKACLGFLFHSVPTLLHSHTYTQTYVQILTVLLSLLCFGAFPTFKEEGWWGVADCSSWSGTLHTGWQICHEGVEVQIRPVLLSGRLLFSTQALSNVENESLLFFFRRRTHPRGSLQGKDHPPFCITVCSQKFLTWIHTSETTCVGNKMIQTVSIV